MEKQTEQSEVGLDAVVIAELNYQQAVNKLFGNEFMSNSATPDEIIVGHELSKVTWRKIGHRGFDELVSKEHIANYASESKAYELEFQYRKDKDFDSVKIGETYTILNVQPLWVKTDGLPERMINHAPSKELE